MHVNNRPLVDGGQIAERIILTEDAILCSEKCPVSSHLQAILTPLVAAQADIEGLHIYISLT